jgi:hypothetical protein
MFNDFIFGGEVYDKGIWLADYSGGNDDGCVTLLDKIEFDNTIVKIDELTTDEEKRALEQACYTALGYGSWAGEYTAYGEIALVVSDDECKIVAEGTEEYSEYTSKSFESEALPAILYTLAVGDVVEINKGAPIPLYPAVKLPIQGVINQITDDTFSIVTTLDEVFQFKIELYKQYYYLITKIQ